MLPESKFDNVCPNLRDFFPGYKRKKHVISDCSQLKKLNATCWPNLANQKPNYYYYSLNLRPF